MNLDKAFFKKHLLTICSAVTFIFFFLPFISVGISMMGQSFSESVNVFDFLFDDFSIFAWLAFLSLAGLVAINYVKQLEKYKKLLTVVLPAVGLISTIILYLTETSDIPSQYVSIGVGFFFILIGFIACFVVGTMSTRGLEFNKEGFSQLGSTIKNDTFTNAEDKPEE